MTDPEEVTTEMFRDTPMFHKVADFGGEWNFPFYI